MTTELLGDDLRRAWATQIRRTATQPYLLALLVGSLFLSAASFYTTFVGMNSFAPNPFVNFCIVFAIQALLFVTSWRIGFALADREALPLFTIFVFVICLGTSVFFSWVALFGTINTPAEQERTRVTRAHRAVDDGATALLTRVDLRKREQVDALLDSPAYAEWAAMVERVGATALSARAVVEAERDRAAADAASRIQNLESERTRLLAEQASRGERASSSERELARLTEARPALAERVARLRSELDAAEQAVILKEGEMEAEERGGAAGAGTGRGPIWRGLRDERNILAANRDATRRLFDAASSELRRTDDGIAERTAQIAADRGASVDAELATLDRRLSEVQSSQEAAGSAASGLSLEQDVERMTADLALFQTRFDLEAFDRAAASCARLIDTMRAVPSLADRTAALSCDRGALAERLNPVRASTEARLALNARCAAGGANTVSISSLGFDEAIAYGRECIALSRLPVANVEDLRTELDRLVLEEDPNATDFVKTLNGWAGGDKLAYLSLSIAIFIDMLVLFSGLIGALSGSGALRRVMGWRTAQKTLDDFKNALAVFDSPQRIARDILALVEPYSGRWKVQGARTVGMIDLRKYQGSDRDLLRAFLTERPKMAIALPQAEGRGGLFGRDGNAADRHPDRFLVSDTLTRALRAIAAGGEEIEAIAAGDGVAGHLSRTERRVAAQAIMEAVHPFEPPSGAERLLRGFAAQVRIGEIAHGFEYGAAIRTHARQVLFGLYNIGLARGYDPENVGSISGGSARYYLTAKARERLRDDRRAAGQAVVPRDAAAAEGGPDSIGGVGGAPMEMGDADFYGAGPASSAPIEKLILEAMEPVSGSVGRLRLGLRPVAYVDLEKIPTARREEARRMLNELHFDRLARREERAAAPGAAEHYLLRRSGIDELQRMAQPDSEARQAERELAPRARVAVPGPDRPRELPPPDTRHPQSQPSAPKEPFQPAVEPNGETAGAQRQWDGPTPRREQRAYGDPDHARREDEFDETFTTRTVRRIPRRQGGPRGGGVSSPAAPPGRPRFPN